MYLAIAAMPVPTAMVSLRIAASYQISIGTPSGGDPGSAIGCSVSDSNIRRREMVYKRARTNAKGRFVWCCSCLVIAVLNNAKKNEIDSKGR